MTRAALQAGFGSYSQCHRVFRSLFGISPREFLASRTEIALFDKFEPLDGE
jgi:AraC-like DNA-binding protein